MKKAATKDRGARGLFQRIAERFRHDTTNVAVMEIPIIDDPSPADIARAREIIEEYGLTHLLRRS